MRPLDACLPRRAPALRAGAQHGVGGLHLPKKEPHAGDQERPRPVDFADDVRRQRPDELQREALGLACLPQASEACRTTSRTAM